MGNEYLLDLTPILIKKNFATIFQKIYEKYIQFSESLQ